MSIVPSPIDVCHIARRIDLDNEDDHGNHPIVELPPVNRKVMSISQMGRAGRGSSRTIMGDSTEQRTDTLLRMAVADPQTYQDNDQVLIFGRIDEAGDYQDGVAYWVDGEPADERDGPWPALLSMFGGVVKLRRVT